MADAPSHAIRGYAITTMNRPATAMRLRLQSRWYPSNAYMTEFGTSFVFGHRVSPSRPGIVTVAPDQARCNRALGYTSIIAATPSVGDRRERPIVLGGLCSRPRSAIRR